MSDDHDTKTATAILAALNQAMDVLSDQIDDDEAWAAFSACHRALKMLRRDPVKTLRDLDGNDWEYTTTLT